VKPLACVVVVTALLLFAPEAMARNKQPLLSVQNLSVTLMRKYNSPSNRNRIAAVSRNELLKMQRCFVSVVKENPTFDAFIWVTFTFNKDGEVTQQNVTHAVKDEIAKRCVELIVKYQRLPRGAVGRGNAQLHIEAR
jgi:hypothetical protein